MKHHPLKRTRALVAWLLPAVALIACTTTTTPSADGGAANDAGPTDGGEQIGPTGKVRVNVTSSVGDVLANARVTAVGTSATANTDATGSALLSGVPAGKPVAISAASATSIAAYVVVTPVADGEVATAIEVPVSVSDTVTPSAKPTPVTLGGVRIVLPPAGSLVKSDGSAYSGAVTVRVADLSTEGVAAPLPKEKDDEGKELTQAPLTQVDVSLFAADGSPLQLGANAKIPFQRALTLDTDTLEALATNDLELTLRRFDPATGGWVDSGVTLSYENGVVSGELNHLSIYGVWSTGYHINSHEIPSSCATGRLVRNGMPVGASKLVYAMRIYPFGTGRAPIDFEETATTDATGSFCIKLPQAGKQAALVARIGTRPIRNWTADVLPLSFKVDGKTMPLPALPTSGDPECTATSNCSMLGELLYPGSSPVVLPRCLTVALLCDDKNECTTDTCDTTPCAANTSCSGCKNVAKTGACNDGDACTTGDTCATGVCKGTVSSGSSEGSVTVVTGQPNPPAFTQVSAPSQVALNDEFAGTAFDSKLWAIPSGQAPKVTFNGSSFTVDTATQFSLTTGPQKADKFNGPFIAELHFKPLAAVTGTQWRLNLYPSGNDPGFSADLQSDASGASTLSLQAGSGGTPVTQTFTLTAGSSYVYVLKRDAASLVSLSINDSTGTVVAGPLSVTDTTNQNFYLILGASGFSATGTVSFVEIEALKTNLTVNTPAYWSLSGSPLASGGVDYKDNPFGPNPLVFWIAPSSKDAIVPNVADNGGLLEFPFDGQVPTIRAHLVKASPPGVSTPLLLTVYSPFDDAATKKYLDQAIGQGLYTLDVSVDAFLRESNGTYRFALGGGSTMACVNNPPPATGPAACMAPTNPPAGTCSCHCGYIDEKACKVFGDPWRWDAANNLCYWDKVVRGSIGGNIDAAGCAQTSGKISGDGSGRDIYNLGAKCTFAP